MTGFADDTAPAYGAPMRKEAFLRWVQTQEPEEIAGRDKSIAIAALGVSLPLAEIYRGIGAA